MTAKLKSENAVVLVTGPSGAGRSTAINALEDLGFETIDNIPISLVSRLLDGPKLETPLALGLDIRNRDFSPERVAQLGDDLAERPGLDHQLVFIDADADILIRRYSETRRRHPLAPNASPREGVEQEVTLLAPLRAAADILIDTSAMTPHELKAEIAGWFTASASTHMALTVESFSYKRGLPRGADMVWDCRFLKNPHWQPDLRAQTGQSDEVATYVKADPRYDAFFAQLLDTAELLLPAFRDERKAHLGLALGCTGGKHRSVAVAEEFGKALANKGWRVSIRHRELERRQAGEGTGL
ncbi:MAG: RNase adapter RapZ [Litoreibacter sp.]|nr:RNase adapter RapZ [Litoreibacter sp.]